MAGEKGGRGGKGRGKKILSGTVVNDEILRRSGSQVHRDNATIWPNHRMMRAAMKKMIVLPAKFARSPG